MIGFNELGRLGRLGNQMFQYASLKGIARNNGLEICIPQLTPKRTSKHTYGTELFAVFDLDVKIGLLNNVRTVSEKHFHFDKELFDTCPDNVSLRGYFQTEKYFKHVEKEIRSDFKFKQEILNPCEKKIESIKKPIALHVRRDDYLAFSAHHPVCPVSYYETALEHFDNNRNVIVFSDDPKWCSKQKTFSGNRFIISENKDPRIDLCLMSLCDDFIIANSSFSWWGAWLSANSIKQVLRPKTWFWPQVR